MQISFLIFNFGYSRLKNLWHTMNVVADIRKNNPHLNDEIEFILIEHGEHKYSEKHAKNTGFNYEFYVDPLLTSHRSSLRNAAVKKSKGEWVILHDNDIIPNPQFFNDILDITNIENKPIEYFSNFKDVVNLSNKLTNILVQDADKGNNKFKYGYINGTDPEKTKNFRGCDVRPHGFFTFTEATGGSFTIKRDLFLKKQFNDDYEGWGAEDNAFKLDVVEYIGWGKFGMLNQTLLHSYHTIGVFDPNSGSLIINDVELNQNRDRLFKKLQESKIVADSSNYSMITNDINPLLVVAEKNGTEVELLPEMTSL